MLRKLTLACSACLALVALGALTPSAYANDECAGLTEGIYPLSDPVQANKGKFDLDNTDDFGNGTAFAVDGFTGAALLCGDNEQTKFYQHGRITTPGVGEVIHCAASRWASGCPAPLGGGAPLPDGAYMGSAVGDATCENGGLLCLFGNLEIHSIPGDIRVNYGSPRCSLSAISCTTATFTPVPGVTCTSESIFTKGPSTPDLTKFYLTIYQPDCSPNTFDPTYFTSIDNLTLCDYAGDPSSNSCGDGSDPTKWTGKNGKAGTWNYVLQTLNIGMPNQSAVAQVSWS